MSELWHLGYFGNGWDGAGNISANTDIARDMYYTNLTISSGITLRNTAITGTYSSDERCYRIHVRDTLTVDGFLQSNGLPGLASGGSIGSNGAHGILGTSSSRSRGT